MLNKASKNTKGQDGSAMVIALLVMILLMGFVALAVSHEQRDDRRRE